MVMGMYIFHIKTYLYMCLRILVSKKRRETVKIYIHIEMAQVPCMCIGS